MCGVSKKTSVEKLWREKANMQMSCEALVRACAVYTHMNSVEGFAL